MPMVYLTWKEVEFLSDMHGTGQIDSGVAELDEMDNSIGDKMRKLLFKRESPVKEESE